MEKNNTNLKKNMQNLEKLEEITNDCKTIYRKSLRQV